MVKDARLKRVNNLKYNLQKKNLIYKLIYSYTKQIKQEAIKMQEMALKVCSLERKK